MATEEAAKKQQTEAGPSVELFNGTAMPAMIFGTWKVSNEAAPGAVAAAISAGYRHIDCARAYKNEPAVGKGIAKGLADAGLKREDLYITSKLANTDHPADRVEYACRETLKDLGVEYLDLYLIHWPMDFATEGVENWPDHLLLKTHKDEGAEWKKGDPGFIRAGDTHYTETWKAMEGLVEKGLVKSIGISNFNQEQVAEVLKVATVQPAVNQIEGHPATDQEALQSYCKENKIQIIAYSVLGSLDHGLRVATDPNLLNKEEVQAIGKKYDKTAAQVLIRYNLDRGNGAITKSVTPSRIAENYDAVSFTLSEEDLRVLKGFNKINWRACAFWPASKHPFWPYRPIIDTIWNNDKERGLRDGDTINHT